MGSWKHGRSGRAGKGPATRLWLDMQARKDLRVSKLKPPRFVSVREAPERDKPSKQRRPAAIGLIDAKTGLSEI
jgi:hypothetical protein